MCTRVLRTPPGSSVHSAKKSAGEILFICSPWRSCWRVCVCVVCVCVCVCVCVSVTLGTEQRNTLVCEQKTIPHFDYSNFTIHYIYIFSHLSDAFIQSNLQLSDNSTASVQSETLKKVQGAKSDKV